MNQPSSLLADARRLYYWCRAAVAHDGWFDFAPRADMLFGLDILYSTLSESWASSTARNIMGDLFFRFDSIRSSFFFFSYVATSNVNAAMFFWRFDVKFGQN